MKHLLSIFAVVSSLSIACTTTQTGQQGTTLRGTNTATRSRSVQGNEFRVIGRADGTGEAYDAQLLFDRAGAALEARRFDAALVDYQRLISEFATSRLLAAAHFNMGQCHQALQHPTEAIASYQLAADAAQSANTELARDALFRISAVAESANLPPPIVEATTRVLRITRLSLVDRVEALARQAAAKLALGDREGARRAAEEAITLAPTAESVSALGDDTYIAQARFLLGELFRSDAEQLVVSINDPQLELAIERRVQLVTHAHVLYNDAIRVGNPHWAAASGNRIGDIYRSLYGSIVEAPLPCDWMEPAIRIYRERTARRLRPLVQGALRAWEATIDMARRNGISNNDWVRRTDEQIETLRRLVLQGPDPALMQRGPNCLPATATSATIATSATSASSRAQPTNTQATAPGDSGVLVSDASADGAIGSQSRR
jgi:tetratricopeptide (TPR) repeat protein